MRDWIGLFLEEDVGAGDVTGEPLFDAGHRSRARMVARDGLVVSGVRHASEVFRRLGAEVDAAAEEGRWAAAGEALLTVSGPTRAILAGERLALNLVARMSGIATATRELVDAVAAAGGRAAVAGTRKTTPGFRLFEKEAIRAGGGEPHRMGLFDEAMVKDNHREAFGRGVAEAVRHIRTARPGVMLSCEVESREDALAAAAAGADWILIDNQEPATARAWAEAVRRASPQVRVEVSGGIRPDNIGSYAWADRVSLGWLTQKAPAKDVSLEWVENLPRA